MENNWPVLNYELGKDTYETLHLFTQIIGKIKLETLPWINHSWHVTLLVSPSGLTTLSLPEKSKSYQLELDFIEHQLKVTTSDGEMRKFSLQGVSVAGFYQKIFEILNELNIKVRINKMPNELANAMPFNRDKEHATYVPEQAVALHKALLKIQDVFIMFRSRFKGKCSPVHFFWGSFDLAVTRFSGREAPKHPGGIPNLPDRVVQEAYSHELCSAGFWPGDRNNPFAAFYSYGYPEPQGYKDTKVKPPEAYYDIQMREYILPYETVRRSSYPEKTLLEFLESSYAAAAICGKWERVKLESGKPHPYLPLSSWQSGNYYQG